MARVQFDKCGAPVQGFTGNPCVRKLGHKGYHQGAASRDRAREKTAQWHKDNPDRLRSWEKANPDRVRLTRRRATLRSMGMTEASFDALWKMQGSCCAICKRTENSMRNKAFAIDHDHRCCPEIGFSCGKCVRGILCSACNTMIGQAKDNPETLIQAAEYLRNRSGYTQHEEYTSQ